MRNLPRGTVTFLSISWDWGLARTEKLSAAIPPDPEPWFTAAVESNGGTFAKRLRPGTDRLSVFASVTEAIAAAIALQTAASALPQHTGISPLRIGIHTGEAGVYGGVYSGSAVDMAGHLSAIAHGGQILLSQSTARFASERPSAGVTLRALESVRLGDLARPTPVFQLLADRLPSEFPPLPSLDRLPNNLPIQLTSFIGREGELETVTRLLASTRLLTLTGPGGCGKTRLALQVAAELVRGFGDGVWCVELAALSDQSLVPQAVAVALGIREEPGRPLLETLTDALRPKSLLLVLDNCEHLVGACAEVADALLRTCPGLEILTTSREPLGITGEHLWRVPSLTVPAEQSPKILDILLQHESVRLFVERAAAVLHGFALTTQNAPAVAQICARLDGIPLAIELAATRVKVLSVEQIAARLDDRFRMLRGGSRTALPRQQTLSAALEWSYDLLSHSERLLWQRLSVFVGAFTLEAAEWVVSGDGIPGDEALDLVAQLVDKSIVSVVEQQGQTRYHLLETIRQFGLTKLEESGDTQVVLQRYCAWYVRLAEEAERHMAGPDQKAWVARLEQEYDNLRAVLQTCDRNGETETGLHMTIRLQTFWFIQGHLNEWHGRLQLLLGKQAKQPSVLRARALASLGWVAVLGCDYRLALTALEEALAVWRELQEERGVTEALTSLAIVNGRQGNYPAARVLLTEALAKFQDLGTKQDIAATLVNLGLVAMGEGDGEGAARFFSESMPLMEELGNQQGIVICLSSLGAVACIQGDFARADALYAQSLTLARETGNRWRVAGVLAGMGRVAGDQGQLERATALYRESVAIRQELGDKAGLVECLEGLAEVACGWGALEVGACLFGAAAARRQGTGALLPPWEQQRYERVLAEARERVTPLRFQEAWAAGQQMTLAQAIDHALDAVAVPEPLPAAPLLEVAVSSHPKAEQKLAGLTDRELEIVRLVARGLTNRDAAKLLFISQRTVDSHIQNIFAKLDLSSRSQLVAWAFEHGLSGSPK